MALSIERIEVLLLIAAVVSMMGRRLHLPYTVGLTLAGVALATLPFNFELSLTKDLIFKAFLPPLLFEAALQIHWRELRENLPVILTLATLGVLLSAAVTALGVHFVTGWSWATALLLGVLISATDPVSVIATFKEAKVGGRLLLLVEAESLFNDGTAAVFFGVALAAMNGGSVSAAGIALSFLVTVLGGVLCGALMGGGVLLMTGQTDDRLVEITFTTVAAYGSFLLAEHFHLSGVLATLTVGVLLGNFGSLGSFSDKGHEAVEIFWEYIGFAANSLIFLLIGISLAHQNILAVWMPAVAVILLVTMGRALAVYGCCALFARSSQRVTPEHQHILFWGGLRGALALALALGLPPQVEHRWEIIAITFAVVAFSVIVQGLTMKRLLRHLGEIAPRQKSAALKANQ